MKDSQGRKKNHIDYASSWKIRYLLSKEPHLNDQSRSFKQLKHSNIFLGILPEVQENLCFFFFVFSFFAKFWLSSQNGRSRYALTSCSPSEWACLWPALAGLRLSLQQQLGWREEGCRMLLLLHRDHKSKTNGSCLQMYGDECSYSARYRPTLSAPGFKKGIFLKKKRNSYPTSPSC